MPKLKIDDCPRCKVTIKFEPIDGWICPKCRTIYCLLELPTASCGTIIGSLTLQDVLNLPSKFWKDVPFGKIAFGDPEGKKKYEHPARKI